MYAVILWIYVFMFMFFVCVQSLNQSINQ